MGAGSGAGRPTGGELNRACGYRRGIKGGCRQDRITQQGRRQDRAIEELKRNDQTILDYTFACLACLCSGVLYARPDTTDPAA